MALYWTIGALPELNHLSERERHHVLRTCAGPSVYFRLFRTAIFYGLATAAISLTIVSRYVPRDTTLIVSGIAAVLTVIVSYQFCMRIIRADLRLTLINGFRGERLPICLGCGYDLKGIEGDQCPECGKGVVVREEEHHTLNRK